MPESLQGKGQTISIGTLVAIVAALGGYQANQSPDASAAIAPQIAIVETKIDNIKQSLARLEKQMEERDGYVRKQFQMATDSGIQQALLRALDKRVADLERARRRR